MGLGPVYRGRQWPISSYDKSWAQQANAPIPDHVRRHHADQHAATHSQRKALPIAPVKR